VTTLILRRANVSCPSRILAARAPAPLSAAEPFPLPRCPHQAARSPSQASGRARFHRFNSYGFDSLPWVRQLAPPRDRLGRGRAAAKPKRKQLTGPPP
jgi:hypothetical protein